jgi:hypothetical protein
VEMGQIDRTPTSGAELADEYDLFAGEIIIDLTQVEDLEDLDGRDLNLETTFGHIRVVLPDEGLDVDVSGGVEAGEVDVFGDKQSSSSDGHLNGGVDVPSMTVDADLVFGEIEFVEADYEGSAA